MKRRQLDREVVVLLLTTLIMVTTWVAFETYRAYIKVNIPNDVEKYLEPIDPILDQSFLDKLNFKQT